MSPDDTVSPRDGVGVEADLGALANGQMTECLSDVGLTDPDRPVQQDGLSTVEPSQGGQAADLRGGQFRVATPARLAADRQGSDHQRSNNSAS